uniref:Uncharacterized protein n=1 Tax=Rhizophora mucronata TaxID=61149 RepID=A0A2P2PCD2_RHIMU
MLKRNDWT